jgi:hypothetical protein
MGTWKLANSKNIPGLLDKTDKFLGMDTELSGCLVSIPTSMDIKTAINNVGGVISAGIRSLEIWWDSEKQELQIVLIASEYDLDKFKQAFYNMYPNIDFEDIDVLEPEWFEKTKDYQIFDVGYRHGHFSTVFDQAKAHLIITQIANTIQLSKFAWIQIVFKSHSFVKELQSHLINLQNHNQTVVGQYYPTSSWLFSDKTDLKDHPEKFGDFATNYKNLDKHTTLKTQNSHVLASVRGVVESNIKLDIDFSPIESLPVENIRSAMEYVTKNTYLHQNFYSEKKPQHIKVNDSKTKLQRIDMFKNRLLPNPSQTLSKMVSNYISKSWTRSYKTRQSPPFLLLTPGEIGLFVHLPDSKTKHLTITRKQSMPQQQMNKIGYNLGYHSRNLALNYNESEFYGNFVHSAETKSIVLSTDDIPTHLYMVGGTKSGKTTLIRAIAKHLELSNIKNNFPNAFIFIDPKGSDSYDFLRQCEDETLNKDLVHFLDPIQTKFSMNILELPPHDPEIRESVVSRYVGYIMTMIKYWYGGSDSFVRLERILDTLLQYLYLQHDKPTFLDLYEIIIAIQADGEEILSKMFKELGKPDAALSQAIQSIAGMSKESYEPVLNRVEKFATDPVLRHLFCVRESTVDFEKLIEPGNITVIRLSPLNIPQNIITLAKQTIVIKMWFVIQERADRIKLEEDRPQVVLALDEFQDIADLPIIESMLTQARSYKLSLLLAHQTSTQLNNELFEIITGNAGTQFVGRVSGRDGKRFGGIWDPTYTKEIESQLATQEFHHWTVRLIAAPGETQPIPIQFWPVFPKKDVQTKEFLDKFIESQKEKYGYGVVGESLIEQHSSEDNIWLKNIPFEPPTHEQWLILCILRDKSLGLQSIVDNFKNGTIHRDVMSNILKIMIENKLLSKTSGRKGIYSLTNETKIKFFDYSSETVGSAKDIPMMVNKVTEHYISKGNFVTVATQKVKKNKLRTDFVAYDYDTESPISIEIESGAEMNSHKSHVKLNMIKWSELGFKECHVWSVNPKIQDVYDSLTELEKEGVKIFVV